ncbi:bifunctional oligoribonuclease/PAP phosphatase NrnA [Anaerovorax odorimutans]|uniref:Bifunctional oligoribonuclease/PAP phosphatase NrnA n=1 Tax=Anaerovorax odorimutans TaxID=109327 RepID=A0ABT1RMY5_9FIRM|nr:bifunctional oligoribonuclease/PAP phosphatase NrnA [Anaerovorax odorimutans]MCQ4636546.1 bifunctional oligoribonuclease/PAP phosphatase NrnA [Anaerovorax odorimutans]
MKKENQSLEQIGGKLAEASSVLLFPHVQMDGDALGSSAALCKALRNAGKKAFILIEDEVPEFLSFLDNGYCTKDQDCIEDPDVCICIDCGETSRFPGREQAFFKGKTTICVDHHTTSEPFADYNYIDGSSAATAEIIYKILSAMGLPIDKEIGEAIFTGICTDTGNFQYSNATKESHLITAALYDAGIDHSRIAVEIYQNTRVEKIRITSKILDTLEVFAGGKAAAAYVTQDMLRQVGAKMEETEGVVETLRNIKGVEVAAFVKEQDENLIKVSMRAKTSGNVADIAALFGGGGHVKAAGCTIRKGLAEAQAELKEAIEESLRKAKA